MRVASFLVRVIVFNFCLAWGFFMAELSVFFWLTAVLFSSFVFAALSWLIQGKKIQNIQHKYQNELQKTEQFWQQQDSIEKEKSSLQEKWENSFRELNDLQQKWVSTDTELREKQSAWDQEKNWLNSNCNTLKTDIEERENRIQLQHQEYQKIQKKLAEEQSRHETLKARLDEKERHFSEQLKLLQENREQLKKDFEHLASEVLERKGKTLSEQSQKDIQAMLAPFREQVTAFRERVENIHSQNSAQQTALRSELGHLKELNKQITEEAHGLATALKGQKKTQGNWGELVLENVLDRSGLQAGKDYKREVSFQRSEGGRARPDVIVYLPQNKHLIIDAKVSLNAYTRYINAEENQERTQALSEHVTAFSNRIKELSDRNYFDLPGLNSPEMVFMFVPVESAFVEALKADESLFQRAIEQNVLVATPTTLLTSLNIVRQLWRFENQNQYTAELAERASKVYDKLRLFIGSMEKVGDHLDKAKDTYIKAYDQLYTGRGNLVKQVSDFNKLGVSVKTELPERVIEKAGLELEYPKT